jgi:phage terminase small subunit
MPGPPRTPTATLRARGSSLVNSRANEVTYDVGLPVAPTWLTSEAKRAWRRLADQLARAGVAQQVDADAFAAYCECLGEVERFTKAIKKHGDDAKLIVGRRKAIEQAYKLAREFGFTPASRSHVQGGDARIVDDNRNGKPFPRAL